MGDLLEMDDISPTPIQEPAKGSIKKGIIVVEAKGCRPGIVIDDTDDVRPVLVLLFLETELLPFRRSGPSDNCHLVPGRLQRARQFQGQDLNAGPLLRRKPVYDLDNVHK